MRLFILLMLTFALSSCVDAAYQARVKAVQDRELTLPLDICFRHAAGEQGLGAAPRSAGFRPTTDSDYLREFDDLDTALSTQGSVRIILSGDCTIVTPIHVIAVAPLGDLIADTLSARGFRPAGERGVFADGSQRIEVVAFAQNIALSGFLNFVRIRAL